MRYNTLTQQTLHYLSRPHEAPRLQPLDVPAAWKGEEMRAADSWRAQLGEAEIAELCRALATAKATGKPLRELGAGDFPLPTLAAAIERWRDQIANGRGFQVIRGVPVQRWSQLDAERFFWCFGLHFGKPGAQNPRGDLLGHVRDEGISKDDPGVRYYRTAAHIRYHCDMADVVGLLCLRKAREGGQSRIASSVSVYNELVRRKPALVRRLYRPFYLDTNGQGGLDYIPLTPCRFAGGRLRTFYHSDYFRSAVRHQAVPALTAMEEELLDTYEEIASSPEFRLDMELEPGDIQLLSNHTQLHSRTEYKDGPEPEHKRHLLRLWISLPARRSLAYRWRTALSRLSLVKSTVVERVVQTWRRRL